MTVSRRDVLRLAAAGAGLCVGPLRARGDAAAVGTGDGLYGRLLADWCQRLLELQVEAPGDASRDGARFLLGIERELKQEWRRRSERNRIECERRHGELPSGDQRGDILLRERPDHRRRAGLHRRLERGRRARNRRVLDLDAWPAARRICKRRGQEPVAYRSARGLKPAGQRQQQADRVGGSRDCHRWSHGLGRGPCGGCREVGAARMIGVALSPVCSTLCEMRGLGLGACKQCRELEPRALAWGCTRRHCCCRRIRRECGDEQVVVGATLLRGAEKSRPGLHGPHAVEHAPRREFGLRAQAEQLDRHRCGPRLGHAANGCDRSLRLVAREREFGLNARKEHDIVTTHVRAQVAEHPIRIVQAA